MERKSVESRSLRWVAYDAETRTLEVEFVSGRAYRFHDVPPGAYAWLLRAPSKGGFFNRSIRDRYRVEPLDPPDADRGDLAADLERTLAQMRGDDDADTE